MSPRTTGPRHGVGPGIPRKACMGILGTLILGVFIGCIAKKLFRGPAPGGIVGSAIVGVLGAFVGTYLATVFNEDLAFPPSHFWSLTIWIYSVLGALVVLFVYELLVGGSRGGRRRR
ncbi:MAG: GlsB/YeaQ/YmgE family stress response membrane protein [Solirubrobacteraceae bacterium]|nr:GlsB/YeaQ/YmgE family stress response membrane protein [Patulibacter sp.]